MLDFVLGALLVVLFVRGWMRGFVLEAMDLLGVVLGVALAFRLGGPAGLVVEGLIGTSPMTSRFIGGACVFVAVGLGAVLAARYLQRVAELPGLRLGNRVSGAGVAVAWGLFLVTLGLSLVSLVSLPAVVSARVEESTMARALTRPDGVPQRVFSRVAGDQVVEVMLRLQDVVGDDRVVVDAGETIELPPAAPDEVQADGEAVAYLFDRVNRERAGAGLDALAWSDDLAVVAAGHATDMYTSGYFAHRSPAGEVVGDRLRRHGIVFIVAGENLALTADAAEAHRGLMESPAHRDAILEPAFTRAGIAAVNGPLGLMVVEVFA